MYKSNNAAARSLSRSSAWLAALPLLLACKSALGTEAYAIREQKACQYCHVSGSPGFTDPKTGKSEPTAVNPRGQYYATHNHTFAGYSDRTVMGAASAPVFHFIWKEELKAPVRRIAVAPVTGDGSPCLITLSEIPGDTQSSLLEVRKWNGKELATVASGKAHSPPGQLAAGPFGGHVPVIVTPDALWLLKGSELVRKPAPRPISILGAARLKSGEERLLVEDGPTAVRAYRIEPDAAQWLVDPIPAPASGQVSFGDMHATPDQFDKLGMPALLREGGVVGLWDVRKFGALFLYYVKPDQDFDVKADPAHPSKPLVTLKSRSSFVVFRDPEQVAGAELWSTPRIPGVVLDVAQTDPRSGSPALLVLAAPVGPGSPSTLYCFALD